MAKFRVGDKVRYKGQARRDYPEEGVITKIDNSKYYWGSGIRTSIYIMQNIRTTLLN